MHDEPQDQKKKLLKLLDDVDVEAKRVECASKDLIQNARLMSDIAKPLRTLYEHTPVSGLPPEEWSRQADSMGSWVCAAKSMPPTPTDITSFRVITQAATNTSVSGVFSVYPTSLLQMMPQPAMVAHSSPPYPSAVQQAGMTLANVVNKYPSFEKARLAILRLGLDKRSGDSKSAMESLEDARQSLEVPVVEGGAVAALIGLRECINTCFTELIRRRPVQEKAGSWKDKVGSLGRHCGLTSLNTAHFDNLGVDAESIIDRLSAAKQKKLSRPEVQMHFNQGVLFIASFLDSIDGSRLKPS
jgi:hypothetical protein